MRSIFVLLSLLGLAIDAAPAVKQAQLQSIEVQRPNIVIHGSYLGKIEVWAVPTGTGITPDEYVLLGHATRTTAAGQNEAWVFAVDCGSLLATQVFVSAFDKKGKAVGVKPLPYNGASEINDALCGGR
jgi:hypothetical protein